MRILAAVIAVMAVGAGPAYPQQTPANLDEYVKLARTGIQQDKSQIVGAALQLDATQAAAWRDGAERVIL